MKLRNTPEALAAEIWALTNAVLTTSYFIYFSFTNKLSGMGDAILFIEPCLFILTTPVLFVLLISVPLIKKHTTSFFKKITLLVATCLLCILPYSYCIASESLLDDKPKFLWSYFIIANIILFACALLSMAILYRKIYAQFKNFN
ncbi:hypothetical protein [Parasediminibacterium sp. JCM 36343]|uniref:hypothetical protein n=1 Tax=Parasediminibacterium sp. JCM 36343 TaxID=3374279 RepID=UPI00397BAC74